MLEWDLFYMLDKNNYIYKAKLRKKEKILWFFES